MVRERSSVGRDTTVRHGRHGRNELRHGIAGGVQIEKRLESEMGQLPFYVPGVGVGEERIEIRRIRGNVEPNDGSAAGTGSARAPGREQRQQECDDGAGRRTNHPARFVERGGVSSSSAEGLRRTDALRYTIFTE